MARIPALERGVGSDRLARWHAMGGRYVIGLITAHVVTIIWGYALADRSGVVNETATMVLTFPDVLKATAALLLLIGVGLVSARAARRRLRYETWFSKRIVRASIPRSRSFRRCMPPGHFRQPLSLSGTGWAG
ncbi:ferric reductase-like transmembrane domain-containing protein [Nonomuraea sp. K274]|uniref:Ferric reductase-like transmembrane domain-containing protein n=2 Tax=Nonomuraea cypriaca TaxID=1187855 RepID=A0A931EY56_9ACTN|nr:ferric reductase-like transmembrane domain-containing protein [Nonomuraea cypriaca]